MVSPHHPIYITLWCIARHGRHTGQKIRTSLRRNTNTSKLDHMFGGKQRMIRGASDDKPAALAAREEQGHQDGLLKLGGWDLSCGKKQ